MTLTTRLPSIALLCLSILASTSATSLRGRQLYLINEQKPNSKSCQQELSFEIECQGDCNFTEQRGTCESKLFMFHGGRCRSSTASATDSASDCQDFQGGPSEVVGEEVYVVIADVQDPSKNSSMWTAVEGFFMTQYQDYPIGLGLSDQQNITIYSSNETTFDNMLQTMLFYAPCEGTPLEYLDANQSVQLYGTAVDPTIRALFHLRVSSQSTQSWQLQSASFVANSASLPAQQEHVVLTDLPSTTVGDVEIPIVVELNRNDTLTILGSATLVTASGLECGLSALYNSDHDDRVVSRTNPDHAWVWP